jgi:putative effector of murein hydrolase
MFLQPVWLAVLLAWCFAVLSAAQLTVRLIMAFSVRSTLVAAVMLALASLPVAVVYDAVIGPDPSLARRFSALPVAMLLMAVAGFAIARWLLRFKRLRGQIITGIMVGILDPHVFALLAKS